MTEFTEKVCAVVKNIPAGQTMSYQAVAEVVGNKSACRAVANIMAKNFDKSIPCHRVIRSDGRAGGYNRGGEVAKMKLLKNEGAVIYTYVQ